MSYCAVWASVMKYWLIYIYLKIEYFTSGMLVKWQIQIWKNANLVKFNQASFQPNIAAHVDFLRTL